ncbi:hypothetical protein G113_01584 [Aeromonas molluscorum 848]|uniref:Uncharacterized protein n=1 Tax=Aeromonas molluscorum 848 TaxID=1268236 RepID=R1FAL6_9GAMM|nr:hypothetical protein G113_01584 [Aeromonas molluscorum 848]
MGWLMSHGPDYKELAPDSQQGGDGLAAGDLAQPLCLSLVRLCIVAPLSIARVNRVAPCIRRVIYDDKWWPAQRARFAEIVRS